MAKKMYFGNRELMSWVPCPAIDSDISQDKWNTSGVYLNGGGYVRSSGAGHKRYSFTWNLTNSEDIYSVLDYQQGIYGDGLLYFLDPFAIDKNLFPQYWAAPRLAANDAPSLVKDVRPTLVDTMINTWRYPTKSAVYTLTSDSRFTSLWIPVPAGYVLHVGVHGTSTDTARVVCKTDAGDATDVAMMLPSDGQRTNTTFAGGTGGITITLAGVGILTLAGMIAQVLPVGKTVPMGEFISGRGHSGVRFDGAPTINGYSAALDKQGASAVLRETGAWE